MVGSGTTGRGVQWLGHPEVSGSIIGAVGGTVFVLVNRGDLSGAWPTVALAAWVVAAAAYVWTTFVRVREVPALPRPWRGAGLVYVGSVLGMLGFIAGGAAVLRSVGMPEAQVALVVTGVGLHFLPFAWAFRAPVFRVLGWAMTCIGLAGVAATAAAGGGAASTAAVLAGLAMFIVMTALALRRVPSVAAAGGHVVEPGPRPVQEVVDQR